MDSLQCAGYCMLFSGPTSKCVYEASLEKMYDYGEDIVGRDGGNVKSTLLLPAGPSVMCISERFLCRGRLKTNIFTDIVSNKRYTVYHAVYYYYYYYYYVSKLRGVKYVT